MTQCYIIATFMLTVRILKNLSEAVALNLVDLRLDIFLILVLFFFIIVVLQLRVFHLMERRAAWAEKWIVSEEAIVKILLVTWRLKHLLWRAVGPLRLAGRPEKVTAKSRGLLLLISNRFCRSCSFIRLVLVRDRVTLDLVNVG